jgi:hypothetical protein
MPDGAAVLNDLGVDLKSADSHPFQGIRYVDGRIVAEGRFPGESGLGIRRTELHNALRSRAEDLGVDLRWGARVRGLVADGFETDRGVVRGKWLVGADGRTSRVRKWSGLDGRLARRRRFGVRRHFEIEPWSDLVEVHWSDGCEAYVTPVGKSTVGVAMLWSGKTATFDGLLTSFEGLALSFRQAVALVDAICASDLGRYVAAHRRIVRYPNAITRLLLLVERHPRLRRRVMRSLAADPSLMSRFLALKMRRDGPAVFGSGGLLPLAASALRGRT